MDEPNERTAPRILQWLGDVQARRPWLLILVAALTLLPSGLFTARLGFKPEFSELLPDNKDSVIEMRRVAERLPGITTLAVTAEIADGANRAALERFVDELGPKIEALGRERVAQVDRGVHESRKFFDQNKLLYAELPDLQDARDQIVERYEYEVQKQLGTLLDESDPPPPITAESIRDKLQRKSAAIKPGVASTSPGADKPGKPAPDPFPGGYYMTPDGKFITLLVRTSLQGRDARNALRRDVEAAVAEVGPARLDPTMQVGYTGDLVVSAEEYDAIIRDLSEVGAGGVIGVLASVLLFFLRVRTVLVMAAGLAVGLLWTFGLTFFTIGYLNSSTGFLVSIIAGNGINYGIIYMARYLEARRDEDVPVDRAIAIAHRDTWLPTLASAATAMLAYGSLVVTDFRGFKHFGIIGGYGMILCWLSTYLFTPAILAASERIRPTFKPRRPGDPPTRARGYYGLLFSKIAHAAPRAVLAFGVLLGVASAALSYRYLAGDPMEYDMRNIRSAPGASPAMALSVRVGKLVGRLAQDGMAIMTDRLDQVPMLEAKLEERYDAAPADMKPFEKVVTIFSLLPTEQDEKIPLIEEMQKLIKRARSRGFIPDKDWTEIEPYLPAGELRPLGIADLPEQTARPFTERDGTRGRIVYIVPKSGFSVWDARYLMRWADSFRYTELPTGEVIKGSGRAVIYADMIQAVIEDVPKATAVAAAGAILIILLAFRGHWRHALGVFLPWALGVSLLLAFLELRGIKLNFLNFMALPITIGIGAEYAHNLMQRYRAERGQRLERVITETGGAVVLCSLTTAIGYVVLMWSINKGIVSFGLAAAVGELACVLAAVLVLPAALVWLQRRKQHKG
ncbi:MAG TPA: MMPL family transporter [Candidatus Nanopelagicales bacterium]|nr:MMPL family transporter [Candidatus Nanopelagicales bacterium]